MSKTSDGAVVFGVGLLAGLAAGVVVAILTTPKAGVEVRQDLKATLNRFVDDLPDEFQATELKSKELLFNIKYSIENQIARIGEAIKAGKIAAAKRKEEVESDFSY